MQGFTASHGVTRHIENLHHIQIQTLLGGVEST